MCSALVRFCSVSLRSLPTFVYYASTIFTFADCLGYESGSNVVSLNDHVSHGLMLTVREHVNAIRMLTYVY